MNIGVAVIFAIGILLITLVLLLGHRYGKMRKRVGGKEHIFLGGGMKHGFAWGIASDVTRYPVVGYIMALLLLWLFFSTAFYAAGIACALAILASFVIGRLFPISKEAREELADLQLVNNWPEMVSEYSQIKARGIRPKWTTWVLLALYLVVLAAVYYEFFVRAAVQ